MASGRPAAIGTAADKMDGFRIDRRAQKVHCAALPHSWPIDPSSAPLVLCVAAPAAHRRTDNHPINGAWRASGIDKCLTITFLLHQVFLELPSVLFSSFATFQRSSFKSHSFHSFDSM